MNNNERERIKFSFEYMYWFSRFEYTLKEKGYFYSDRFDIANPDWNKYINEQSDNYTKSTCAAKLIKLSPKEQKVQNKSLVWEAIKLDVRCNNDLCKIVLLLKVARNNLFHGAKHNLEVVNIERDIDILQTSINVIKELAELDCFGAEVFEPYQDFNLNVVLK